MSLDHPINLRQGFDLVGSRRTPYHRCPSNHVQLLAESCQPSHTGHVSHAEAAIIETQSFFVPSRNRETPPEPLIKTRLFWKLEIEPALCQKYDQAFPTYACRNKDRRFAQGL